MNPPLTAADSPPVRFAALGLDHIHALGQVAMLLRSGAEFAAWYGSGNDLSPLFEKSFPQARRAADPRAILEDPSIALVTCAAVPDRRARLAIVAMQHGKDVLVDKPGAVTLEELEELRAVQRETGRIWTVFFSERLESRGHGQGRRAGAGGRHRTPPPDGGSGASPARPGACGRTGSGIRGAPAGFSATWPPTRSTSS